MHIKQINSLLCFLSNFSVKKKNTEACRQGVAGWWGWPLVSALFALKDAFPHHIIVNKWKLRGQRKTKRKTESPEHTPRGGKATVVTQ